MVAVGEWGATVETAYRVGQLEEQVRELREELKHVQRRLLGIARQESISPSDLRLLHDVIKLKTGID